MSQSMYVKDVSFSLPEENKDDALAALQSAGASYQWWRKSRVMKATTLEDALEAIDWQVSFYDNGDIIGLEFNGENLHDEDVYFETLAPFVLEGSYIEVDIEGELGRWYFNGTTVEYQTPRIVWPTSDGK